jgi:dCTP deaminase
LKAIANGTPVIKNDAWITKMAQQGMIAPFEPQLVRAVALDAAQPETSHKVISYGLSSYGYDLRLSPNEFRVFRHVPGTIVDPKNFNPANLEPAALHSDRYGSYFILPAHSYGLGVALERLEVPDNVSVICIGKSTYARIGLIANLTPAEAGWRGHLTLEFSNSSSADCRIYASEGIVQLLFFEGEPCNVSYADRQGKYQDQSEVVTLARI